MTKRTGLAQAREQIGVLRSAIDAAGDVVLIYRVGDRPGELVLVYMNEAYTRQTGYTEDDALGSGLEQFRLSMPDDPGMAAVREALRTGKPAGAEVISYRKDGSSFWNQITLHPIAGEGGRITHWISVERDVSDAIERETQLEDQHRRLLEFTDAASRLFSTLDARALVEQLQAAVRDLLRATCTVYTVLDGDRTEPAGDELIARAVRTRGHVIDERRFRAAVWTGESQRGSYVIEVRARSGRTIAGSDRFILELIAEYFGVAIRNASLNKSKADLIAMLAHDFRGPLSAIVGFADLVLQLGPTGADQREYLEEIKRAAFRLSDLAGETLRRARAEDAGGDRAFETVDLAALAHQVAATFGERREIRVTTGESALVSADVPRLHQLIANLIENAVKYSSKAVDVRVEGDDAFVQLVVEDRGIGIPEAEFETIFDRFSRGSNAWKREIPGSGFGLYLAREIAQAHGGTLSVRSSEGEGSTFTLTLPAYHPEPNLLPS